MPVTIYHNPQCVKSCATLKLLEGRGLRPKMIEYLKTPPSETELRHPLKLPNLSARELLRKKKAEYEQAKLDNPALTDARIIHAMAKHPKLIERPIVVSGKKAILGRPPENVLKVI